MNFVERNFWKLLILLIVLLAPPVYFCAIGNVDAASGFAVSYMIGAIVLAIIAGFASL